MTFRGRIKNGLVVLDEPATLPEGAAVRVEVLPRESDQPELDEHGQTLGQKLMKYAGRAKDLPADLARHHDHYIHGTPKE
jgi:hypothetical protein